MTIGHISDTARWVAHYRAMETARADAIFRDPFAAALAGEHGERIMNSMRGGKRAAWAMIVRTKVFDEIILETIATQGVDTVVNLAAGLCARPWRLPLSPSLRWVDVDFPEILAYKSGIIGDAPAHCRYEQQPTDLTDDSARAALFARLGAESKRALVVTEGLIIYLTPEQVGGLARGMRDTPSFGWWLTDLAHPRLLRMMNRSWARGAAKGNAKFQFAPAEGTAWFRSHGWRERAFHSAGDAARRLHREMAGMWFWDLVARLYPKRVREEFKRMAGYVLFERS
ncbi:MAG: class I SAM-dependent methyltransferase [Gemmatimonadetes bacterium]|nr:class I SAM-dependent methyltransferase [Gemmatimonadota bacterium]MBI3504489.1 class I SAM-dependent methyltransferase [Pseudomonadota bacterium]